MSDRMQKHPTWNRTRNASGTEVYNFHSVLTDRTNPIHSLSAWGSVIFVIGIVILSWSLTGLVTVTILRNRRSTHISYLFIVSMSVATVIHASANFPSSVIFDFIVKDSNEIRDELCIIWIFLETTICHSILLHLLGSSLDTYLRLHMPQWYGLSGGRPATVRLKLAAPWIVSTMQTAAQVLLGDPLPPARLEEKRLCTCPDVNFLILRTSVAFAFPLLVSVVILFLAAHKLQCLYRPRMQSNSPELPGLTKCNWSNLCNRGRRVRANPDSGDHGAVYPNRPAIQDKSEKSMIATNGEFNTVLRTSHSALTHPLDTSQCLSLSQPIPLSPCYQPNFRCQPSGHAQGSGSSDTGISSQTTDENDDVLNLKRTTVSVSSSAMPNLDKIASSPYGTLVGLLESNQVDQISTKPVTVMDHFCPQHGHVTLSLQPEGNFKSTLSPVVEHEPLSTTNCVKVDKNAYVYTSTDLLSTTKIELNPIAQSDPTSPLLPLSPSESKQALKMDNDEDVLNESPLRSTFHMEEKQTRSNNAISANQYYLEQTSIKLNMITCALSIALWAPFITASLAHILLSTTRFNRLISVSTLIQFKWLSYMSSIAYLIGYLIVDRQLCRLVLQQCRFQRRRSHEEPSISVPPAAYSCLNPSNGR